jgi:Cu-processing system ATP-binding protein
MVVEMSNIWCSHEAGRSLRCFSLALEEGDIAALLGPPGSGKTTVVELIIGWRRPRQGTVRVLGENPAAADRMVRYQVGTVLDPPGFCRELTVIETLVLHTGLYRLSYPPRAIRALLERVGLAGGEKRRVGELLREERCQLALARALITSPRLVLLDEPFRGLGRTSISRMWDVLIAASRDGSAILITSRNAGHLQGHATRIAMLTAECAVESTQMVSPDTAPPVPA